MSEQDFLFTEQSLNSTRIINMEASIEDTT